MFQPVRYHIGKHRWFYTALTWGVLTWFTERHSDSLRNIRPGASAAAAPGP